MEKVMYMKVYLVEPIHQKALSYLREYVEICDDLSICDGLITRNIKVDASVMEKAKNLKVIGIHGTGINDVDVLEAKRRNIIVFNAPDQNSLSVAEMNVMLMLLLSKKGKEAINYYPSDVLAPITLMSNEVTDKTAGFIGVGNIALKTAKMLHFGFNMRILGYNRTDKRIDYIEMCDLEKVLKESDYLFVGMALNDQTRGMINEECFSKMKKSAYLINTARGAIVDEPSLLKALREKQIAGYGADVFEHEPNINPELGKYNVVMTPHIAASTDEALYRVGMLTVKQMVQALMGQKVEYEIKE